MKQAQINRANGQALVEFALAVPFVFLLLVSMLYFGRYFMLSQVLLLAAQEGARSAAKTPDLADPTVRDTVRGFSTTGSEVNPNSVVYAALAGGYLLSNGNQGDMPSGSAVAILPFDSAAQGNLNIPDGAVAVSITYPFQLLGNPFKGTSQNLKVAMSFSNSPLTFFNFPITQTAVAAEEVYQANQN